MRFFSDRKIQGVGFVSKIFVNMMMILNNIFKNSTKFHHMKEK